MSKYCFNFESGQYENIDENGFSMEQGAFVNNWDDSEYQREREEEQNNLLNDDTF